MFRKKSAHFPYISRDTCLLLRVHLASSSPSASEFCFELRVGSERKNSRQRKVGSLFPEEEEGEAEAEAEAEMVECEWRFGRLGAACCSLVDPRSSKLEHRPN